MRANFQVTARAVALAATMFAGLGANAQAQTNPAASCAPRQPRSRLASSSRIMRGFG
jgi:hypothetical protein